MRKTSILLLAFSLAVVLTACKKDLMDMEVVKEALELTFHNDVVDPNHTWTLMNDWSVTVTANVPNVKRVEVLSANPYNPGKRSVEILAMSEVTEDQKVKMYYSAPIINDSVYIAAINTAGDYRVVAIKKGKENADFNILNTTNTGTMTTPTKQEVYYCYCNSFPQPSATWSFHDLVYRISKEVISDKVLRLNVTLAALGNVQQMAGALRLDGIDYDDVEDISISNHNTFVKYEASSRTIIKDEDTKLRGQDGTAVINLFDDAHLAFFIRTNENGFVTRYYINVTHNTDVNHLEFSPVTVSYDITFKKSNVAQTITFGKLDPFILYYYNSNVWEVHKYAFKFKETLYSYYSDSPDKYDSGFTWALEIPYTWFRYPIQGVSMGSYKNGVIYGAYQQPYHSFGEWGANKDEATDWYLYPSSSVY